MPDHDAHDIESPSAKLIDDAVLAIAADIDLLLLDVDGVLTDGSIVLDDDGRECKRFHVKDGLGLRIWIKLGLEIGLVTGRAGGALRHRARELGITRVLQGVSTKAPAVDGLCRDLGIAPAKVAYIGDDWPDLPAMALVGLPMAVADASPEVRKAAKWVSNLPGGHGAVREAVEFLVMAKGLTSQAMAAAGLLPPGPLG
ncbi:MAG: HAD-IIIA family hydrolase [Phycisphaeraceae bacterium]|nr:HAD-IIIA family hydrolase [Phycisphaeraceae bacterium]MCW5753171.1 HAD-IIIA family hydrolase [Phycisphaeraceae bacterium]